MSLALLCVRACVHVVVVDIDVVGVNIGFALRACVRVVVDMVDVDVVGFALCLCVRAVRACCCG